MSSEQKEAVEHLREAWRQADAALKSATNAYKHNTDASVVYGCTGFAIEHLKKLKSEIEAAGKLVNRD